MYKHLTWQLRHHNLAPFQNRARDKNSAFAFQSKFHFCRHDMSLKRRKQSSASFIYLLNVHNFLCWRIWWRLLMVLPRACLSFIQAARRRYARPVCSILSARFLKRTPTHRFALRQLVLSSIECKLFTGADKDTVWCSVDVSGKDSGQLFLR